MPNQSVFDLILDRVSGEKRVKAGAFTLGKAKS
jgi:hypothetical protein